MHIRTHVVFVALLLAGSRLAAQGQAAEQLDIVGGTGGSAFTRACPAGAVLTGIRARVGLAIDAIGIKCRPIGANGVLGGESDAGSLAGGSGGQVNVNSSCPQGEVVASMRVSRGVASVGFLQFNCHSWSTTNRNTGAVKSQLLVISAAVPTGAVSKCSRATQPIVALRGRAAMLVDALGATCNEP